MLGALAAIVLLIGSIGATVSVTESNQQVTSQVRDPVVLTQTTGNSDILGESR